MTYKMGLNPIKNMTDKQPFVFNGTSSLKQHPCPLEYYFKHAANSDEHSVMFTELIHNELMRRLDESFTTAENVSKESICNWCLESPDTDNPFEWIEHTIKCVSEHTPKPENFRNSALAGEFVGEVLRRKSALTKEFVVKVRNHALSNVNYENTDTKCPWCKDKEFSADSLNYYDHVQQCSMDYRRYRPI